MKAVIISEFGGPEVLKWVDVPYPICGESKVIIQIKAASINHLDIWVREGLPIVTPPIVLGSDGSGVIVEIGKNVTNWTIGDEVMVQPGTYCGECRFCKANKENYCERFGIFGETENGLQAEYFALYPKYLEKKPEHISFEEAAAFPLVFLTSYTMLVRRADIQPGETVLVLGATSGIGSAAIQIAKLFGCYVIATAGSEEKIKFAGKMGADETINHTNENIYKRVKEITHGRGVDVVFEHVGPATWRHSLGSLAKGGRLVTCGATTGSNVNIDLRHLFMKQQTILGSTMGDARGFRELVGLLDEKKLSPVLDKIFPMSQVAEAHKYVEARKQFGKVVLVPDP